MKFDVLAYQSEVARRFTSENNEIFLDYMSRKGYLTEDGRFNFTPEQLTSKEFHAEFIAEVEQLDLKDVEPNFTEEELRSYFIK